MRHDTLLPQVTRLWFEIKDKMTEELSQNRIWLSRHECCFETIDISPNHDKSGASSKMHERPLTPLECPSLLSCSGD